MPSLPFPELPVRRLAIAAGFLALFVFHTYPLGLSDFWWHLNTARWIWENGRLPVVDPFLFTSSVPLDERASLILRGYPLAQLLMLGVYHLAGLMGLLVLKGALMTLFYFLLWHGLKRNGLNPLFALAVVLVLPLLFYRFDELRPQVFSFIGTLAIWLATERILERERDGKPLSWQAMSLLPLGMLLWASLHRGFIIGMGMLVFYFLFECLAKWRGKAALSGPALRRLGWVVAASLLAACVNPNGLTALWASFSETAGPFSKVIDEFWATHRYFELHAAPVAGYGVLGLALAAALALLAAWRRVHPVHGVLALAFLVAGMLSFRFSLMMVAMLLLLAARYHGARVGTWLSGGWCNKALILWLAAFLPLGHFAVQRTALMGDPLERTVMPEAAVDYLAEHPIRGNLFNPFEMGGYLGWRLYPRQIFMDQRNLSWPVYQEYAEVWRGNYQDVFQKYGIGAVIYPALSGRSPLVLRLMQDPLWQVGFFDGRRVVLYRRDMNPHLPALDKFRIAQQIQRVR